MNRNGGRSIALVSGFGAQNIGNAFFNVGGLHVLRQAFPDRNVQFIQDQPGYWTFNRRRQNPGNYCDLISRLDIDFIVLQGPVFSSVLPKLWDHTLGNLYDKGTRVIYLSSAFFKYTDEEVELTTRFLRKYPPALISTRDSATFEKLKSECSFVHNGICSAWFVPEVYSPIPIGPNDFMVMNFDRLPEPRVEFGGPSDGAYKTFGYLGREWNLRMPALQLACSKWGKAEAYLGAAVDLRKLPKEIMGIDVIRPEHRTNPHFSWKIYGQPGGVASDEPYTYFNIYANSKLTLSDRVHACVMTLAYGNPAMLFSLSPRTRLFDRMGLADIRHKPVSMDLEQLALLKSEQIDFLRKAAIEIAV